MSYLNAGGHTECYQNPMFYYTKQHTINPSAPSAWISMKYVTIQYATNITMPTIIAFVDDGLPNKIKKQSRTTKATKLI